MPAAPRTPLPPLRHVVFVAVGGAVGGLARTAVSLAFPVSEGAFPWSTFGENILGAFLLGMLLGALGQRTGAPGWVRPAVGTGLLGAFTTYATLSFELERLLAGDHLVVAAVYLAGTLVLGLAAALAGGRTAGRLLRRGRSRP